MDVAADFDVDICCLESGDGAAPFKVTALPTDIRSFVTMKQITDRMPLRVAVRSVTEHGHMAEILGVICSSSSSIMTTSSML